DEDCIALATSVLTDLGKDAVPALLEVVKKGLKNPETQKGSNEARYRAGTINVEVDGKSAIPALLAIFKAAPGDARDCVAGLLGDLGEPVVKPLVALLPGLSNDARVHATAVLMHIGGESKTAADLIWKSTLELLKSKQAGLRAVAVRTV